MTPLNSTQSALVDLYMTTHVSALHDETQWFRTLWYEGQRLHQTSQQEPQADEVTWLKDREWVGNLLFSGTALFFLSFAEARLAQGNELNCVQWGRVKKLYRKWQDAT